jgi:hypothetical protein
VVFDCQRLVDNTLQIVRTEILKINKMIHFFSSLIIFISCNSGSTGECI